MSAERRIGGVCWRLRGDVPPDQAILQIETALAALRSGEARNQKRGRRKELYPIEGAGWRLLLKVNHYEGAARWWRRLHGSKAHRELHLASHAARLGIPTPVPIAAGEERRRGALHACYLLVPFLEGARDLRQLASEGQLPRGTRRQLASAFGVLSRRVHEAGIFQDDFAPNNFLAELPEGAAPRLSMIDFERARLRRRTSPRERMQMLAKLDRELPQASLGDRGRFLRAYAGGDRAAAHALWRRVERAGAELAERDLRRLARSATRAGRRYTPLQDRGLTGFAARVHDPDALLSAAERALREPDHQSSDTWVWVTTRPPGGAAGLWARAILIGRRGLGPIPAALLDDGKRLVLLSERREGACPLREERCRARARRALAVLLGRLLGLGTLRGEPGPEEFAFEAGRALLLAPDRFSPTGRPTPGARLQSRALAERLLPEDPPAC